MNSTRLPPLVAILLASALGACGPARIPSGINDPFEEQNRLVHAENTALDRTLVGPSAKTYGQSIPEPVRHGVGNFAENIDLPRSVVNNMLQLRVGDAVHNTLRFAVNTTIGLGGIFDPASAMGVPARKSDFGETLHRWGVGEGHYVELPVLGPSTERDTVGVVVDLFLNPLGYVLPSPERHVSKVAGAFSTLGDRYTYGGTVESILYNSADSYAQTRLVYLEKRRFELRRFNPGGTVEEYFDPYAEPGQTAAGGGLEYFDPYEDVLP